MQDQPTRTAFGTGMLVLATISMAIVLSPFWKAIFWSVVLAVLFWPLRERVMSRLPGWPSVAAGLMILIIALFGLVPGLLIAGLIVDGAAAIVAQIQSGEFQPAKILEALPARFPKLAELLPQVGLDLGAIKAMVGQAFVSVAQFAVAHISVIGQGASAFLFHMFLVLYVLFSLLLHGDTIYRSFFDSFPASRYSKERFFAAFSDMAVATLKGMLSVGVVQAILGGAILWLLGVPSAIFWGAMMGLLSVVPPFGAGFIWGPAGIVMMLNGNLHGGLILLVYGAVVISMSDNIIRPIVVGRASSVPGYMVLVSTLGGLAVFGLTGLVLGPVLASLFLAAWQLFNELEKQPPASPAQADDPAGIGSGRDSR